MPSLGAQHCLAVRAFKEVDTSVCGHRLDGHVTTSGAGDLRFESHDATNFVIARAEVARALNRTSRIHKLGRGFKQQSYPNFRNAVHSVGREAG
jgi:hypothetical protein